MKTSRIGWGVIALFLGILVPTMHHVLLHWPAASQPHSNPLLRAELMLRALPWVDWAYLGIMTVVGLMLVMSGMESKGSK